MQDVAQRIQQLEAELSQLKSIEERPRLEFEVNGVEFAMIVCPKGRFLMGSPPDEKGRFSDETQQEVEIKEDFAMAETMVTQELWQAVMGDNPSHFKDPQFPVDSVSYYDLQKFIKKINQLTGQRFRLPTSAEWEYAARAGTTTRFWWGDEPDPNCAHYESNAPIAVASKRPNPWGLYDMGGLAWQWTSTPYQRNPAPSAVVDEDSEADSDDD